MEVFQTLYQFRTLRWTTMAEGWTVGAVADPLPPWSSRRMAFPSIAPGSAPPISLTMCEIAGGGAWWLCVGGSQIVMILQGRWLRLGYIIDVVP